MICDPGPVFGLAENRSDIPEAQFAEDPKFEDFPIWFLQSVQGHMDAKGGIPIRRGLLNLFSRIRDLFGNRGGFALTALLIVETVFRDGAQPGDLVRFLPELFGFGESPEESFLGNLFRQLPVTREGHGVGEYPHVVGFVQFSGLFPVHNFTSFLPSTSIRRMRMRFVTRFLKKI